MTQRPFRRPLTPATRPGGGRVVGGHTYYSSSIVLKSNIELHLEQGAVLKAHAVRMEIGVDVGVGLQHSTLLQMQLDVALEHDGAGK